MVRMSQWYTKMLEAARLKGVIASFDSSSHILALENFPATLLTPPVAAFELSPDMMKTTSSTDIKKAAVAASHPRLFCAGS